MIRILLARLRGLFPSAGREQGKGGGSPDSLRRQLMPIRHFESMATATCPRRGGRRESSVWKP